MTQQAAPIAHHAQHDTDAVEFYLMTRRGIFRPSEFTDNQCRGKGWPEYYYQVAIAVSCKLDADGFIIDHQRIDDMIQQLSAEGHLKGSCEQMHVEICKGIRRLLMYHHGAELYACKSIITPEENTGHWMAPIQKVWAKHPQYLAYLSVI